MGERESSTSRCGGVEGGEGGGEGEIKTFLKDARYRFDKAASLYFLIDIASNRVYNRIVRELPRHFPLNKDTRILEVMGGTGLLSRKLLRFSNRIVCTDISYNMIRAGKKSVGVSPIRFHVMDASCISYTDNTFDLVVEGRGFHAMPDALRRMVLGEMYRVSKSYLLIIEPHRQKNPIFRWIGNILERLEGGYENYLQFIEMDFEEWLSDGGLSPMGILDDSDAQVYLCKK